MIDFSGKKIAVLGLGIEGEDVCEFLLKHGATDITIFDQKTAKKLGKAFKKFKGLKFRLGKDYLKDGLIGFNIIFRSPAFKLSLPEIQAAKKAMPAGRQAGVEISSATKLFFQLCPGKIIGVTGTKGKGTTATLIYRILREAGKKVFLAGNIGEPALQLLSKLDKKSWVILELSSFQLQDLDKNPQIAVVLFITSEHLDYHKNTAEYIEAKTNIVRYQKKSNFCVLNADSLVSASFSKLTPARVYFFSRQQKTNGAYIKNKKIYVFDQLIGSVSEIKLRGEHNWDNVCAAATAGKLVGIDNESIKKVIFSFSGLEHRLELVREKKGISFYNDSFSTTPETAIAAIKSFNQPIILIAGGSEKGSNYVQLGQEIAENPVKILILIGQMAKKIKEAALNAGFSGKVIEDLNSMKEIVETAFQEAKIGDVVLLSPACASFGMFANYKDRGKQFKKYVKAL